VATQILAFDMRSGADGQVTAFADLAQWEAWAAEQARAAQPAAKRARDAQAPAAAPAKKKLTFSEQHEYDRIEARITDAEAKLAVLDAECARPEVASDAARLVTLMEEIAAARAAVDVLYERWAELEAKRSPPGGGSTNSAT
jgi:ATP-binding cassette subfamily F protein uup